MSERDAAPEIARSLARASTITGADAEAIAGASMKLAALGEIVDLVYENASLKAERDDLATRLSEYLCDSTGGLLSKTGYDVPTMVLHTEEYYDRVYAEERKEVAAERDAYVAAVERVRAIHRKFAYYEHEDRCPDTSEDHREERHHESDEIGEFYCEDMPTGDVVCDLCRDADGERMEWPCPTAVALGLDRATINML